MNSKHAVLVLKIAVAGEFLGHGVLALKHKAEWLGWFGVFGVENPSTAVTLLTLIGLADIAVALIVLFRPVKPVLLWAAFWGLATALVRPVVGQPIWDFVERLPNAGAPLALYFLTRSKE